MKKLFLIIPLFLFACNNSTDNTVEQADTVVVKVDSAALRSAATTQLFMNVLMYTEKAYEQHEAHEYAEGHILEFKKKTWVRDKALNEQKMTQALAYMQHAITTPGTNTFGHDTTGQYLNLFTYIINTSCYMDTYPDSLLIVSKDFPAFKTWFQSTCENWMRNNRCTNIVSSENSPDGKYILKIRCNP